MTTASVVRAEDLTKFYGARRGIETVALEAGNNAHVDVLAALLTVAALMLLSRSQRAGIGAALLGLAIATKITPVLTLPAVLRRRPVTVLLAAAGAIAGVYLPHVLAVGADVIGFLPGYLGEEGYRSGRRFALLSLVLPQSMTGPAAVVILAAVGCVVLRTANPDQPWRAAVTMTGAALLITTPTYPWYALLLVAIVALDGRAEWLALGVAGYLALYARDIGLTATSGQRLGYGAALILITVMALRRQRAELVRSGLVRRTPPSPGLPDAVSDEPGADRAEGPTPIALPTYRGTDSRRRAPRPLSWSKPSRTQQLAAPDVADNLVGDRPALADDAHRPGAFDDHCGDLVIAADPGGA